MILVNIAPICMYIYIVSIYIYHKLHIHIHTHYVSDIYIYIYKHMSPSDVRLAFSEALKGLRKLSASPAGRKREDVPVSWDHS